ELDKSLTMMDKGLSAFHGVHKTKGAFGQFLSAVTVADGASFKDEEKTKKLSNFSSSVSDKSKLLNDEVQIKTTELNDISSQYNSTVEAIYATLV
ncbi:virulence-associated V antigen, partial [Vibrio parahaemolyticus]|uniref:virulence-associated V antigen n=1 Tax=Vibrio parahaemolyticus TaxID=670 RepID=UPI0021B09E60